MIEAQECSKYKKNPSCALLFKEIKLLLHFKIRIDMANNKGLDKGDERLESVEEALSKSEQFIVNNQKKHLLA